MRQDFGPQAVPKRKLGKPAIFPKAEALQPTVRRNPRARLQAPSDSRVQPETESGYGGAVGMAMSGDVKGETGDLTWDGKSMWAHREPTADEEHARQILAPWFAKARDEKGRRIPLSVYLERLHG